jgi:CheY-like chemotaxis protein
MRVLVVDDDEMIREVIRDILAGPGREIHLAESCAKAFKFVYANRYDLVTLDLNLPDGCGLEVLDRIRRDGSCARALVVSGNAHQPLYARWARKLGVHALIEKPFDSTELRQFAFGENAANISIPQDDTPHPAPSTEGREDE